ncbi:hypothetical protein ADL25_03505 [Streptomyces sp. NRRL F-5122]|uniref:hypothetical protein n=1 Tax=Streptomyces sp. NRRL F-5122 TaxID=1609098 RepID=UPI000740E4A1|nr:hypothetical protein [Streptomyces sp. NRRL F-5122]KUJ58403.1 hypothetical protein ADL25_03505 [Streptomyces sp. NRRL F-5122]
MAIHARVSAAVGLALVAAVTAGCGGSGLAASGGSSSTGTAAGGTGSQIKPAPTESNPAGDIPDNQVYVAYQPSAGSFTGFTVKVPEGWARSDQGNTTVFTDKLNTVRITTVSSTAPPTASSVTSTIVPQVRSQVPKFAAPKVSQVTRRSGRVVLLTYQGDSAKDPVTGKVVRDAFERYVFHQSGHEVDLTLSGPVNADNVDPWRIVSDSFAWR